MLAAFVSISASHLGTALFTACSWAAARAISAPAWETRFSVGLCLNKSSQKYFVPSHRLQFCVSGSISLSTFSQLCEFVKLDFLMLPDYRGGEGGSQK